MRVPSLERMAGENPQHGGRPCTETGKGIDAVKPLVTQEGRTVADRSTFATLWIGGSQGGHIRGGKPTGGGLARDNRIREWKGDGKLFVRSANREKHKL